MNRSFTFEKLRLWALTLTPTPTPNKCYWNILLKLLIFSTVLKFWKVSGTNFRRNILPQIRYAAGSQSVALSSMTRVITPDSNKQKGGLQSVVEVCGSCETSIPTRSITANGRYRSNDTDSYFEEETGPHHDQYGTFINKSNK